MIKKSYAIDKATISYILGILNAYLLDGFTPRIHQCIEIRAKIKKDIGKVEIERIEAAGERRTK